MQNFHSYQLAKQLYQSCKKLSLKGELKDQLERASLSIALSVAEGSGKRTLKDRKRFYYNALGSLRECQALVDIIDHKILIKQYDKLGALIWGLCRSPDS